MASVRNVQKSLVAMEDLQQGVGPITQSRNASDATVNQIDTPYAVTDVADMQNLDIEQYTRARVYSDDITFIDYIYDENATSGIESNTGAAYWVETARDSLVLRDTVTSDLYRLTVTNGSLGITLI